MAAVAGAAAFALTLGGATAVGAATDVPPGTTVLGVDIGGRDKPAATRALLAGVGARLDDPVHLRLGGTATTLEPASVDLNLDADATVERAAAGWPNPIQVLFGRDRITTPVIALDEARLNDHVSRIAPAATVAKVTYSGLTPKASYGKPGPGVDPGEVADALRDGWLRGGEIAVPLSESPPRTPDAEVDRMIREFARPAVAAPVTVTTPEGTLSLPPRAIAKSLVISADGTGAMTARVDEARLRRAWAGELARVEKTPREAVVPTASGEKVIARTAGQTVDLASLGHDLIGVLPQPAPRSVSAVLTTVPAQATEATLAEQGIVERISSFTTHFDGGQDRNRNIIQVAKEVDGAIVKPGETFSLNGYTGPRGYAEGYVDAPVISNGKLVNAVGGGISQFTTTLFNAAYYAGLEDVFHQPHSYYFSRYPSVIEATIFYPSLDMKFRNDSDTSVLIDTSYDDTSVTVTMWGTKRYDVSTVWGPRTNITEPKTVRLADTDGCIATKGIDGFTQQAWRVFKRDGREVNREPFSHTYQAEPRFVCGD